MVTFNLTMKLTSENSIKNQDDGHHFEKKQ